MEATVLFQFQDSYRLVFASKCHDIFLIRGNGQHRDGGPGSRRIVGGFGFICPVPRCDLPLLLGRRLGFRVGFLIGNLRVFRASRLYIVWPNRESLPGLSNIRIDSRASGADQQALRATWLSLNGLDTLERMLEIDSHSEASQPDTERTNSEKMKRQNQVNQRLARGSELL